MSKNSTIREAFEYVDTQLSQSDDPDRPMSVMLAQMLLGNIKANLEAGKTLDDVMDTELVG